MLKAILLLTLMIFSALAIRKDMDQMKREMDFLEKDLENAHLTSASKKSLNDLTTEDLINELKKEVDAMTKTHEDTFRPRFEAIIQKKSVDEDALWKKSLQLMANDLFDKAVVKKDDNECIDKRTDCENLKSYCKSHRTKLENICAKTCRYCSECKNKFDNCQQLAESGQCERQRERMAKYCPVSCGICKAPAPPKCSISTYGCCWDKETRKLSKDGNNCPACRNHYKFVCKTFADDCSSMYSSGEFMRFYCPKTCKLCDTTTCQNDPKKAFYCPLWKEELDWCSVQKETMRHFCPKECGFC